MAEIDNEPAKDVIETVELPDDFINAAAADRAKKKPFMWTGLAYSRPAEIALVIAKGVSLIGILTSPIAGGVLCSSPGGGGQLVGLGLILGLIGSVYHFAIFVVISRVQDRLASRP